ncbi:hypothetical protein [Snuella sedimenti]|uniref:Uncharacterized protein n=1 Tax=Snuella sedimenti TaxID=2798802 RepID=A0A8J7J3P8_9FLAO|nr:hypothetical protein [Snuella sedimenti]MBJ6369232.1 hypothetical protein [Snuella sedimenti]
MTKLTSILCSCLILVQSLNISLEDFSKLDVLLELATFHAENYGCTFLDFLEENYGDEKCSHTDNHHEHDDLPFKHDHKSCHHIAISFTINSANFDISYAEFVEIPCNFFYKDSYSLFERPSIFQPPRV